MEDYWNRFASFANYPSSTEVYVQPLAKSGFYYEGNKDEVVCYSCKMKYSGWKKGDKASSIHRYRSPNCKMVNSGGSSNNGIKKSTKQSEYGGQGLSYSGIKESARITKQSEYGGQGPSYNGIKESSQINKQSDYGGPARNFTYLNTQEPKHPEYSLMRVRQSSFFTRGWSGRQNPADMAKAGFFYSGKSDLVICFFCGQRLHKWDPDDNEWEEHTKWSKNCAYLRQCQDQKRTPKCTCLKQCELDERSSHRPHVAERNERPSAAISSVIDMGYSENTVDQAWNSLKKSGKKHINAADLLSEVWKIAEGAQENSQQTDIGKDVTEEAETTKNAKNDGNLCKVCFEEDISIVFLPCGHLACCRSCASGITHCVICRSFKQQTVEAFIS